MTVVQIIRIACLIGEVVSYEAYKENVICAIVEEADVQGVEVETVLALAWHESRFRKDAVSSEGARGVLQVLPLWFISDLCRSSETIFWRRSVICGVRVYKRAVDTCDERARALGAYNTGRCRSTRWSRLVAADARRLRQ
jgi:membrane-bound lytic murein transglycosylase MltF